MKLASVFSVALIAFSVGVNAQQPSQHERSFEVASIRPGAAPDAEMIPITMKVDRSMIHYENTSLRDCIRVAYGVKDFQISGPDWIRNRYNIEARYPASASDADVPEMLQALLRDRFGLQLHREMKEHAVLALVVDKNGPKLTPSEMNVPVYADDSKRPPGTPVPGSLQIMGSPSGMHLKGPAVTLGALSETLSIFTVNPVVDQTSIQGQYDFDLNFVPDRSLRFMAPGGSSNPDGGAGSDSVSSVSLSQALEQYGLKLEPRKAPMMMLVVDHLNRAPTGN